MRQEDDVACLLHDCDDMLRVVWIMMRAAHLPLLLSNDEEIDHIVEMLVPPCTNECVKVAHSMHRGARHMGARDKLTWICCQQASHS